MTRRRWPFPHVVWQDLCICGVLLFVGWVVIEVWL